VILLDEPLAALDPKLRKEMQLELRRIHSELGSTFVYVTHDQEEALVMSDRIVIMNDGAIVEDGPPAEIYSRPKSLFAATFIGEVNLFYGSIAEADGELVTLTSEVGNSLKVDNGGQNNLRQGQSVILALRPEQLKLEPRSRGTTVPEGVNSFEGRVAECVVAGSSARIRVELKGGREAWVAVPVESASDVHSVGDDVWVLWAIDRGRLLVA
jgi:ABC-type Fe3+/spermidine/putrescine transport system ATPase subunit